MSAIGIDLGTTNSCVAVYRKNQVEIIVNDDGKRVTPSVVSFTEDERLVGEAAQSEAPFNFENTIFQVKRIIGRTYDDPIVQADMKLWGFTVINDDNKPKIPVISSQERKIFCPEEISAMVLESLKSAAMARLDEPVTDAVITIPAYFNNAQRKATLDAGKIAGLNVLRMINEPTAAAIAYGLDRKSDKEQNVLVFDLGGGTFDVTIVKIIKTELEVQATGGDTHLGGDDFDNRMVKHFVAEFNKANKCDMSDNKLAMNRLRVACEAAKRKLSSSTMATVQVDGLHNGRHFRSKISRAKFEELNYELFKKLMEAVKNTLIDADMKKDQIDTVVLVGGSTRIPKVHELLKDFFSDKKINKTINPDEAVAYGAAALAANLSSEDFLTSEIKELKLQDVTPLSLGLIIQSGLMRVVVKRNTRIPTTKSYRTQTAKDYVTSILTGIYEGERAAAKDNHFLGSISIDGIPPALKGVEIFENCFEIDQNGILTVTRQVISTGVTKQIIIGKTGRLSPGEVREMKIEAEKFAKEDELWKKKCKRAHILENFVYNVTHAFDNETIQKGTTDTDRKTIKDKCNEITEWLDMKKGPKISDTQRNEQELEAICRPIFSKIPEGLEILEKMKK